METVLRTTEGLLGEWGRDTSDMAEARSGPGEGRQIELMDCTWTLSIDQDITARIDIVTPGHLENYDRKTLEATCEFIKAVM